MSSYNLKTKHPKTGKWENATWIDGCFGGHNYGVIFPSDKKKCGKDTPLKSIAFDPRETKIETKDLII